MIQKARAIAYPNIALIKYWGKLDESKNLPAVGSLSLTLNQGQTETTVELLESDQDKQNSPDIFILNQENQKNQNLIKISKFLDLFRAKSKYKNFAKITSTNAFPTASGLASSASGFAALTIAAAKAYELNLDLQELAKLAQQGSASAARSLLPNYVRAYSGYDQNNKTQTIQNLNTDLDLSLLILQVTDQPKDMSSRDGMGLSKQTSPFFEAWVNSQEQDLKSAEQALINNQFTTLGELVEYSTLKMHSLTLSARPGFWYFNDITLKLMQEVKDIRKNKILNCYFTSDAGPHLKILVESKNLDQLEKYFNNKFPKIKTIKAQAGPGAQLIWVGKS